MFRKSQKQRHRNWRKQLKSAQEINKCNSTQKPSPTRLKEESCKENSQVNKFALGDSLNWNEQDINQRVIVGMQERGGHIEQQWKILSPGKRNDNEKYREKGH